MKPSPAQKLSQVMASSTDHMFHVAAGSNWLLTSLRTHVLPLIAPHLFRFDAVINPAMIESAFF